MFSFIITVFENIKDIVDIKNTSDVDFNGKVKIEKGATETVETKRAKLYFGDWDNNTLAELNRRRSKGIDKFKIEVVVAKKEEEQIKRKEKKYEEKFIENEFIDLKEEKKEEEIKETPDEDGTCIGQTKSGTNCKAKATIGAYCHNHAPKEK